MGKRLPRILGMTAMATQYHKEKDINKKQEIKNKIIAYVVNQWVINNGLLCEHSYNINSLASLLCCDIEEINYYLQQRVLSNKMWDKDQQENLIMGIMGMKLSWSLEDRQEAASQAEILKRSQGGHYVPFISSELRQTLDLKMKATSQLGGLIKDLTGGTHNIFQLNQQFNSNDKLEDNTISHEEALSIIAEEENKFLSSLPSDKDNLKILEEKYHINELPEVSARGQDFDSSKEGLELVSSEIREITDNYKIHREEPEEVDFHEIRRELEMNIDGDEEDPELMNY